MGDFVAFDGGSVGKCLAYEAAEGNAAAMACPGASDGVGVPEEIALCVADGKQTLNGLVVGGADL